MTVILQVSNFKVSFNDRNYQLIGGIPLVSYLIRRIRQEQISDIILATSDRIEDDIFETIASAENIKVFRGDYDNVLGRLCRVCEKFDLEDFVRVFANNPLLDIEQMINLYQEHVSGHYDYSYNEHRQGVLWGMGCEVFHVPFLKRLNALELQKSQRENISFFIRQSVPDCRILKMKVSESRPSYKVCLETKKDLEVIRELVQKLPEIRSDTVTEYLNGHKVLSLYNQEEPAKEVGLEKLFLHPSKISGLMAGGEMDLQYPISVEMTLTNRCNLRCVWCSDAGLRSRQGKNSDLSIEVIRRLFEDLGRGGTKGIVIEGGGEPTLYKGLADVVHYAGECGLALGLITNGTVKLNSDLLKKFEWIRVSLDASTSREYLESKGVDCFERVLNNIAHYAKYCNTVGVGYVVTNKNLSQIEALVQRLRESGVSYIQMRPVVDCEELYPDNTDLSFLKCYQSGSFSVITDGMSENAMGGNHSLPCRAHSLTTVISGDGSVFLCGRLNVYNWLKPIGNINNQTFHDIWLGEERKKQAAMVNDPEFCLKSCPQCRISKFNALIDRLDSIRSKHFI